MFIAILLNHSVHSLQNKLRGQNIFKPHAGFKTKIKFCLSCELFIDLDKEEEQARQDADRHRKAATIKRSQRHTIYAVETQKKRAIRMKTGDGNYGTAMTNLKSQAETFMDVERKIKDGAVEAAANLPPEARKMVMEVLQNTVAPKFPCKNEPNPAWSPISAKEIPRFICVRAYDPSKGRNNMNPIKKVPKVVKDMMDKDPNLPHPEKEPSANQEKINAALKVPDKIQAQQIARKAIRVAEAYARNVNNILKEASGSDKPIKAVSPKDLEVVDLSQKQSKTFLCTHNSLPVDCCTCCKEMSSHCCEFCKQEKAEIKKEKAIEKGEEEGDDDEVKEKETEKSKDKKVKQNNNGNKANNKQASSSETANIPDNIKPPPVKPGVIPSTPKPSTVSASKPAAASMSKPSASIKTPSTKSKAPSIKKPLPPSTASTSSETSVPEVKSPTTAERMGVLPSPFKHTDGTGPASSSNDANKDNNNNHVNTPVKKKSGKPIQLPPRSKKTGFTPNAEEVECQKEWEMNHNAMSRHQNTLSEHDGGVLPVSLSCINHKKQQKIIDKVAEINDPQNTVDIFPTKINIAKACNTEGTAGAAACLAAKAAVRAKMAALDAVKAAKVGDIAGATEALRNAAMGKSGRAGKSTVEKKKEEEEEGENEKKAATGSSMPPPPDDGIDKTPVDVPKFKPMPAPKESEGPFTGKAGVPSVTDQGKIVRGDQLDPKIQGLKETELQKKPQEIKDEKKVKGPQYETFLELAELWKLPEPPLISFAEFKEAWEQPPMPDIGTAIDNREDSLDPAEQIRQVNEKKQPMRHKKQYAEGEGPVTGKSNPGEQANEDEEPEGNTYRVATMVVCINESSENLAVELLGKLVIDAKTKVVCVPEKGNRRYNTIDRWKFAGGR